MICAGWTVKSCHSSYAAVNATSPQKRKYHLNFVSGKLAEVDSHTVSGNRLTEWVDIDESVNVGAASLSTGSRAEGGLQHLPAIATA